MESKLKIAFFNTKVYETEAFEAAIKQKPDFSSKLSITYIQERLCVETAHLSAGYEAICIFVNDTCNAEVIKILAKNGIKHIILRCAGFNNVDAVAAK